jgi:hypothetical protein
MICLVAGGLLFVAAIALTMWSYNSEGPAPFGEDDV